MEIVYLRGIVAQSRRFGTRVILVFSLVSRFFIGTRPPGIADLQSAAARGFSHRQLGDPSVREEMAAALLTQLANREPNPLGPSQG
jgi:hypothetical protein